MMNIGKFFKKSKLWVLSILAIFLGSFFGVNFDNDGELDLKTIGGKIVNADVIFSTSG